MFIIQEMSGEMTSQLLLDRLHDDVVEVVDTVLSLNDVCHVLMLVMVVVQYDTQNSVIVYAHF